MQNVVLLTGEEEYLIDKKAQEFKNVLYPEFNLSQYSIIDEKEILTACESVPFMSDKRVVIVDGALDTGDYPLLTKYIDNPISSTTLVLISPSVDRRKKLYKALSKNKAVFEYKKLSDSKFKDFLKNSLVGCKLKEGVIDKIAEKSGYQYEGVYLYDVVSELEKLKDYAKSKEITIEIIESIIKSPADTNVFKLVSYINKKDKKALSLLKGLIDSGENELKLLALLSRNFRLLYKIKSGASLSAIGIADFQAKDFYTLEVTKERALAILNEVAAAQNSIKSGHEAKLALEILVTKLLNDCV